MAAKKQKLGIERLEQIQATAQSLALNPKQADAKAAANLAEEAAGLALELLQEKEG
jgi:uncharacterized protein YciW